MNSFHKAIRKMRNLPGFKFSEVHIHEGAIPFTQIEFKKIYGMSVYWDEVPECKWAITSKPDGNLVSDSLYVRLIF